MRTFALDLIKKSARQASARLQFCRLAFGAAGSAGAQIETGDAENVARGLLGDDKIKIAWNLPRELKPKNQVKLLLNMLLVAVGAIPRGGALTVEPIDGALGFRIIAAGLNARVTPAVVGLLAGNPEQNVDAHGIQPFYTGILARDCGLTVTAAVDGETVVVTAR
jgi:histidine phosphotransferase ChpT